MPSTSLTIKKDLKSYVQLRREVEETLLLGQQKIEEAKVETYLETGKLIDAYLLQKGSREERYGKEVIEKLSTDLKISSSVLWRCLQFACSFKKILARGRESFPKHLAWSHYRKLITIHDEGSRISFMQRAEKGGWTAEKLIGKIRLETQAQDSSEVAEKDPRPFPKLIPKKGLLYTYRLIAPDSVHAPSRSEGSPGISPVRSFRSHGDSDDRLWIDLGFQVHRRIPLGSKGFKEGDIVESLRGEKGEYSITASRRAEKDLFSYKAFVERVVDADTLIVKIDLGFETWIRQYLRLRGINAPELDTEEGKKAKAFVERELSKAPHVILTSSRSDKYDRYLADVFYEKQPGQELYLNQVLLDQGFAERM
jgi:hypothetical protein